MSQSRQLPEIWLARHGETEWTVTHQHTGRSDIPLTERGERNALALGERLRGTTFTRVFVSPLQRAQRTADLAGFKLLGQIDPDLMEWDYGQYDGLRGDEIRERRPDWLLFRDGCPGGESVAEIGARADRVVASLRPLAGRVLLFGHSHFFRVLAARWLGLPPSGGSLFFLGTASLSILGYEHSEDEPAVRLWNDDRHVTP
ncbi:MAG: histidine phosphatase family protein [Isosphaeraceae bacterium]